MEKSRVLVTGGSGFVGRALVARLLMSGHRVRATWHLQRPDFVHPDLEWVRMELSALRSEPGLLDGVETVFHLAGIAHVQASAEQLRRCNYQAVCELLELASRKSVRRFQLVSSVKAGAAGLPPAVLHGSREDIAPALEADPYGYWKRQTEIAVLSSGIGHVSVIRPALVYGAGVKGNLRSMLKAVRRGFFPLLPETGSIRSMIALPDLVSAMLWVVDHPEAHRRCLVVEDGHPYTAASLCRMMYEVVGRPQPHWVVSPGVLQLAGIAGDALSLIWPGCPLNRQMIDRLLEPAEYHATALRAMGWQSTIRLETVLPEMLAGITG